MFCPVCKAEYRPGFTRCADCDTELVEAPPKGLTPDSPSEGNLILLWSGQDLAVHQSLLDELKAVGIPHFDRPIGNYSRRAFPNRFPGSETPLFGFEVSVLSSDLEKARRILAKVS